MTEEIIIDGVNVAGCANLDSLICNCGVICKGRDCYYKQLKRLEQENKELGRKVFLAEQNVRTTAATFCEKDNKIIELEKENKKLKEEKLYRGIDRQFIEDANDRLYFEAEKYRKALEEIKEINNKWLKRWMNDSDEVAGFEEIDNKINEALK